MDGSVQKPQRRSVDSRRAFLRAAALMGAGAGLFAAAPASAFRLLPADDYAAMIENGCLTEKQIHEKILADVQAQLGIKLSEEEAQKILDQMRCPFCGCNMLEASRSASVSQPSF